MCIDDFAIKRGTTYGTVMIDMNARQIIDMIETRECEPVTEWLKSYPNLRVISRDGSVTYKNAIESSHPKAVQVSDRFHLLKNLTEYATEYLKKELPAQIVIKSTVQAAKNTDCQPIELPKEKENRKLTLAEKYEKVEKMREMGKTKTDICRSVNMDVRTYDRLISMTSCDREQLFSTNLSITHEEKVARKMKRVNEVRDMKSEGLSNREISRRTGVNRHTVANYLDGNFNPVHAMYGQKKAGILTPYIKDIDNMLEIGTRGTDITQKIRLMGYSGSDASVRHYITTWKRQRKHFNLSANYGKSNENGVKTEVLERKDVFKLLFYPTEQVIRTKTSNITWANFDTLCDECPCFAKVHAIVWDFRNMFKSKDALSLFGWLKMAKSLNIREINSFVAGVERDFAAVYNGISFDYSNGLAEGKVTKLKLIKRIMYGRCHFSTLRTKVLALEKHRSFNYLC